MSSLKVKSANKVYPSGSLALYDINFETGDREFFVILGADGSGKSTLLRCIAGLEDLSSGEISIDGNAVTDEEVKQRDVAMVFKSGAIKPTLNVYDNLAYGLKLRKASGALIEHRVKAVAEVLGLTEVLYRMPKTLNAMQKQRVAIGRAVIREPRLYLLDEPLAGLDGNLKSDLLNVIMNMQARMQGTFVYATKNSAEAMTAATRIAVIKEGVVQQTDTPANLYDYPVNAYAAFAVGQPTVNFLYGAVITSDGEEFYAEAEGVKIKLTEKIISRFEMLKQYADAKKTVIIGIRPEDATLGKDGFEVRAGKSANGYTECTLGNTVFTARDGNGSKVSVDGDRLFIFDGQTRLTLLARDGGYVKTPYADADYVPPAFDEEEEIKKRSKPQPKKKK